jgi:hypothetical protein
MRFYLGRRALGTSQAMSELSEEDAMRVANEELRTVRNAVLRPPQSNGILLRDIFANGYIAMLR